MEDNDKNKQLIEWAGALVNEERNDAISYRRRLETWFFATAFALNSGAMILVFNVTFESITSDEIFHSAALKALNYNFFGIILAIISGVSSYIACLIEIRYFSQEVAKIYSHISKVGDYNVGEITYESEVSLASKSFHWLSIVCFSISVSLFIISAMTLSSSLYK